MKKRTFFRNLAILTTLLAVAFPLRAVQTAPEALAGTWSVEVYVETEVYYLTLTLRAAAGGGLEGTVSESYGSFTDVSIGEVKYEDANLSFQISAPTPPDGLERTVSFDFAVKDEASMEGTLGVPDLGVAGRAVAAKS